MTRFTVAVCIANKYEYCPVDATDARHAFSIIEAGLQAFQNDRIKQILSEDRSTLYFHNTYGFLLEPLVSYERKV